MQKIRLTKEFSFEMAHALHNYDGLCKNIHGHSYRLFVTIIGTPNQDANSPKYGMVVDFGDIKTIVEKHVVSKYDHSVVINSAIGKENIEALSKMTERVIVTDYQPTCENILLEIVDSLKDKLPKNIELHSLRLYETTSSFAEWFQSDNL